MYLKSLFACPAFVLLVLVGAANAQAALTPAANESKPVITRKDDLPRHSYQLDLDVLELYQPENREALLMTDGVQDFVGVEEALFDEHVGESFMALDLP